MIVYCHKHKCPIRQYVYACIQCSGKQQSCLNSISVPWLHFVSFVRERCNCSCFTEKWLRVKEVLLMSFKKLKCRPFHYHTNFLPYAHPILRRQKLNSGWNYPLFSEWVHRVMGFSAGNKTEVFLETLLFMKI